MMSALLNLVHQIRHDETVLEVHLLERTSDHGAGPQSKTK
jgi:hypothetical protein